MLLFGSLWGVGIGEGSLRNGTSPGSIRLHVIHPDLPLASKERHMGPHSLPRYSFPSGVASCLSKSSVTPL